MLNVEHLSYTYPKSKKHAVNDVSFHIEKGEIFGFLGPNGAGKSTTQKVIIGLLSGYNGTITIQGKNLEDWSNDLYNRIGVCFELPNHYLKLTARENLELFSSFYDGATVGIDTLLEMVELKNDADERVSNFSKGMKTKLNIARSLLNDPDILFLDEPTTGLDPVSAHIVKNIIKLQRERGKAIFLTTHNMQDAEQLCNRVGFIVDGALVLTENPRDLKLQHGERSVIVEYLADNTLLTEEYSLDSLAENKEFHMLLKEGSIQTIHTQEATLDDIFIKVTGRKLL